MSREHCKLSDETYEFIKNEVAFLLEKYEIRCIPISGFEIASKMGIILVPYSILSKRKLKKAMKASEDGFYCEEDGKEYIFYNNIGRCYERQNMTILHEIGHCVLDHTGHSDEEEAEANFFAKYAIAPPVLVDRIKAKSPWDIVGKFDISFEAACNAYNYYQRWKRFHYAYGRFKTYEVRLLKLFETNVGST